MHGVRLVSTPAPKMRGRTAAGFDESWVVKSKVRSAVTVRGWASEGRET
jgi:hypothetical protein